MMCIYRDSQAWFQIICVSSFTASTYSILHNYYLYLYSQKVMVIWIIFHVRYPMPWQFLDSFMFYILMYYRDRTMRFRFTIVWANDNKIAILKQIQLMRRNILWVYYEFNSIFFIKYALMMSMKWWAWKCLLRGSSRGYCHPHHGDLWRGTKSEQWKMCGSCRQSLNYCSVYRNVANFFRF